MYELQSFLEVGLVSDNDLNTKSLSPYQEEWLNLDTMVTITIGIQCVQTILNYLVYKTTTNIITATGKRYFAIQ